MSKILITLSLLLILILSSCNGFRPSPDTERTQFYQGSEGVKMSIDRGAPPPKLYFYKNEPREYNSFSIDVELHNVGAAFTRGGLYVSGYDPSLIKLDKINIMETNSNWYENCRVNFDFDSWDAFNFIGAFLSCEFNDGAVSVDYNDDDNYEVRVRDLFGLFGLDWINIDAVIQQSGNTSQTSLGLGFGDLLIQLSDEGYHGINLLSAIIGLEFDRYNGEEFFLRPDNHLYPGGESVVIPFEGYIDNTWPEGLDETQVTFLVTSCYAYTTYATPVVCIDPAPFSDVQKACLPGSVSLKSTQGAPVAVTRVTQENTPRSVIFNIDIANVGNGEIYDPMDLELCSPYYLGRVSRVSKDVVILGDIRMSGSNQKLKCSPESKIIKLRDGKGSITCTYDLEYLSASSAYKAPLIVELWYGYRQDLRRDVLIKRAG